MKKLFKIASLILLVLTTFYLIDFYILHPEILVTSRADILTKFFFKGVLPPVIGYILSGFCYYHSTDDIVNHYENIDKHLENIETKDDDEGEVGCENE